MKRISTPTKVVDKFGAGKPGFTNGNAVTGLPSTDLEADWFDHLQEEVCRVIEAAGGTPDGSAYNMLAQAIQVLISRSVAAAAGSVRGLTGSAPGTSAVVTYAVDELVTGDGAGNYQSLRAWAGTINMTTLGPGGLDVGAVAASTWYYSFAISKPDGTKSFIASLSSTAPSLANAPGFTKWARIGSFRTDGTANKYPLGFDQAGRRIEYKIAQVVANGTINGLVSLANFIAPTYARFIGFVFNNPGSSSNTTITVSKVSGGVVLVSLQTTPSSTATSSVIDTIVNGAAIFVSASAGTGTVYLNCLGYEDNF